MEAIDMTSHDGTNLHCRVSGDGPPMVLVHGALSSKESFGLIEPLLSVSHRVLIFDRRGRGESSDSPDYAIEREAEDIVALVKSFDAPVHLVGDSYGATCSVVATALGDMGLASLTLYEPPSFRDTDPSAWAEAVDHAERGEHESALRAFAPLAGLSDSEVTTVINTPPVWDRMCDAMPTLGRELDALHRCDVFIHPGPLDATVRTLHIKGGETNGHSYVSTTDLSRLFPDMHEVTLKGHGHVAFATGPTALAQAILNHTIGQT